MRSAALNFAGGRLPKYLLDYILCGDSSESSIWQMTMHERRNAATFLINTTVRPFIFMGSSFKCFYCSKYYSEVSILMEHTSTHKVDCVDTILKKYLPKGKRTLQADISDLNCRLCKEKYENLNKIKTHLETTHGIAFTKAENGMIEYNMEFRDGVFNCHLCPNKFHNFSLLNAHMNTHVGKVVCESCGAAFLNQHLLNKHRDVHSKDRFLCKFCDKAFSKKSQVKYHTEIVHKGKERVRLKKCSNCSETFKEHYKKMTHMKLVHGITKTFQCHICQLKFPIRRALTEHITKNHTEKYKCQICSKCFSNEWRLTAHMPSHSGERNFVCHLCKNAYIHKTTLVKHLRSHNAQNSDFKFVCSQCGSGFHAKCDFTKHLRQWHRGFEEMSVKKQL